MGTKFEYTYTNPLAANSSSNNSFFLTKKMSGDDIYKDNMDKKLVEKHNLDSIKRTMQMQEDTFKHQVKELHRLYTVQKTLMTDLKKTTQNTKFYHNMNVQGLRIEETMSSREKSTGSFSGDNMRMARGFDLERPAGEDMSSGVSAVEEDRAGPSRKKGLDESEDESEVELTLSIGGTKRCKEKEARELNSSASFKADRGGGDCSDPATPISSQRKRPHWLFQGLSLNSGT